MARSLVSSFTAALEHPPSAVPDELEARLDAIVAAGHEAWPAVALDPAEFVAHLGRRLAAGAEPIAALAEVRAADLWLACACARGEPNALRALDDHHLQRAARAVARFGDPHGFVADAMQELRARVLVGDPPRIAEYSGSGPLEAWLKVAAVRVAINLREQEVRHGERVAGAAAEPSLASVRDPELDFIKAQYRGDLTAALRAAFAELDTNERAMMRFYLIDRLNIAQIGALFGLSRATVGRRIIGIREKVLDHTRTQLKGRLELASEEIDSLIALLRSQVDVSLTQLLDTNR